MICPECQRDVPVIVTPQEKWARMANPQGPEDYRLTMTMEELMEVPEAAKLVAYYKAAQTVSALRKDLIQMAASASVTISRMAADILHESDAVEDDDEYFDEDEEGEVVTAYENPTKTKEIG